MTSSENSRDGLEEASQMKLLIPSIDAADPEFTIAIPALNEQITIGTFVDWCKQGIQAAGIKGEILIIDSSTDQTPEIALAHGARVLRTPKRGLGRAYICLLYTSDAADE